jgi:hypothetical protein
MLNNPNKGHTKIVEEDEASPEWDKRDRCGEVDRDEVAHLLVEEDVREELSGYLSW